MQMEYNPKCPFKRKGLSNNPNFNIVPGPFGQTGQCEKPQNFYHGAVGVLRRLSTHCHANINHEWKPRRSGTLEVQVVAEDSKPKEQPRRRGGWRSQHSASEGLLPCRVSTLAAMHSHDISSVSRDTSSASLRLPL